MYLREQQHKLLSGGQVITGMKKFDRTHMMHFEVILSESDYVSPKGSPKRKEPAKRSPPIPTIDQPDEKQQVKDDLARLNREMGTLETQFKKMEYHEEVGKFCREQPKSERFSKFRAGKRRIESQLSLTKQGKEDVETEMRSNTEGDFDDLSHRHQKYVKDITKYQKLIPAYDKKIGMNLMQRN